MNTPSRPILRWHGGKWRLAPWIIEHMPPHQCYVEPFGGAASVLLRKGRASLDVYNDLDGAVVTLFRLLRDDPEELIRRVEMTPFSREDFGRAQDFSSPPANDMELCLRLLVRSHMGFSTAGTCGRGNHEKTGFRARGVRAGTTPPENWRRFPPVLRQVAERMQGVVIESLPARRLIEMHDDTDTLFYLDPPYLPDTRDPRADYNHEMTERDHEEMLDQILHLEGAVILSGYPSEIYDSALSDWVRVERQAMAEGARARVEVLWMNFDPASAPPPGGLFSQQEQEWGEA